MKKATKRLSAFVFCCILCGVFCFFSSAKSTNEYGIGLTVNSTAQDNSATVTLNLKNSNSFDVSGVELVHTVPDGLELKSEIKDKNGEGCIIPVGTLTAGSTYEAQLVFDVISAPIFAGGEASTEALAVKKTNEKAVIAAVIAAAVLIAVVIIFARKHKKAAALLLALTMLTPVMGMFVAQAANAAEPRSFSLEETITVGDKSYPVSITVNYTAAGVSDTYFELEAEGDTGKEKEVNRSVADFSGTAIAGATVSSVTYEVRSGIDGFETGSSGAAVLNGCDWSADNVALKHGDNTVTFTATLDNGETQTYTQEIYYDAGEIYQRTKDEEAEENGIEYVKEIVNIYFDIDTTDERINEILADFSAERVGEVNDIVMVQARVKAENLDELNEICAKLEEYDEVIGAGIEQILPLEINVTTNDPWTSNVNYKEPIDEAIPKGYNWHAEAVQAYSTWEYDEFFSTAKVGIIDGPVMTNHEDLQGVISFNGSYASHNVLSTDSQTRAGQYHGTHVASIIGATPNNGIGVSGMLWDVDIYAANFQSSAANSDTLGYVVSAVSSHVTNGAKAVNLSLGLNPVPTDDFNPYEEPYTTSELDLTAKQCAVGMNTLIKSGKEFVVVQSAGNGVIDTRLGTNVRRSADATQNGLYCSIRQNARYGSLTTAQVNNVFDRVIVVGAASNQSNNANGLLFEMAPFSNAGSRVDIYAPGYSIMGATTPQKNSQGTYDIYYAMASGTSQAAPVVTATAAMCFAINPNFTGAEVKNLIKENARCDVYDYSNMQKGNDGVMYDMHPLEGNGRMLSMKLVAEAAMRTVVGKASYTQLNRIVAAAQSLNPGDFTNYEIVQAVIDSIDYNLYAYQQDLVDAKYMELLAAMDRLIEVVPADYSEVEKAKAEAAALNPDDYVDFSGVTSAVNAVVYGKYSDEQAAVDNMAQAIRDAIAALRSKASIDVLDPSVVADNGNKLIVFTTEYLEYYFDTLEATGGYTAIRQPNSSGTYSTGSTVTLSKDGCEDVAYVVAVLGDVDGNGKSDANDAFLAKMCALGILELPHTAYVAAADADCDGAVTVDDSTLIEKSTIFEDAIFNNYTAGE